MIMQLSDQISVIDNESERIRKEEARKRSLANLRPIKPGEVRNPRGRPKKDYVLADLAQVHAEKAIATLVSVMSNEENPPAARISAASELLDRGFGRAPQSLDVKTTVTLSEEFEAFVRSLGRKPGDDAKVIEAAETDVSDASDIAPR